MGALRRTRSAPPANLLRDAVREGLTKGLNRIGDVAASDAPVDTGELRESRRVTVDGLSGTVAFTARHAAIQHERLDLEHPKGGTSKYLEKAMVSEKAAVRAAVVQAVRSKLTQ